MSFNSLFYSCFILILFCSLLSVGLFMVSMWDIQSVIIFFGFFVIMVPVSFEFSELLLTFFIDKPSIPQASLTKQPKVALLYTTCDDALEHCLLDLSGQSYENYEIFILDDSQDEYFKKKVDQFGYQVVRRDNLNGFKGGNLNNWIFKYGAEYEYFIILDSDSIIPSNFIAEMVRYAAHPNNADVAIFQSKIIPWNQNNLFSKLVGEIGMTRMHIIERVGNELNMVFSFGHNNLHRTKSITGVGGFNEMITPEDLTITFSLSAWGESVKVVDIISYDKNPDSFVAYKKRLIRWAKQTIEVFRFDWKFSSLSLKVMAIKNLFSYLSIFICPLLLLSSIWKFDGNQVYSMIEYINMMFHLNYEWLLILSLLPLCLLITNQVLAFLLGRRFNLKVWHLAFSFILNVSIAFYCCGEVLIEMVKSVLGHKTNFIPTNAISHKQKKQDHLLYLRNNKYGIMLIAMVTLGLFSFPLKLLDGIELHLGIFTLGHTCNPVEIIQGIVLIQ